MINIKNSVCARSPILLTEFRNEEKNFENSINGEMLNIKVRYKTPLLKYSLFVFSVSLLCLLSALSLYSFFFILIFKNL